MLLQMNRQKFTIFFSCYKDCHSIQERVLRDTCITHIRNFLYPWNSVKIRNILETRKELLLCTNFIFTKNSLHDSDFFYQRNHKIILTTVSSDLRIGPAIFQQCSLVAAKELRPRLYQRASPKYHKAACVNESKDILPP